MAATTVDMQHRVWLDGDLIIVRDEDYRRYGGSSIIEYAMRVRLERRARMRASKERSQRAWRTQAKVRRATPMRPAPRVWTRFHYPVRVRSLNPANPVLPADATVRLLKTFEPVPLMTPAEAIRLLSSDVC